MTNNYYMPAEWEEHERCWMAWPCREGVWANARATQKNYAGVAHAIADFEPVTVVAPPRRLEEARNLLGGDIEILEVPIDDSWTRDSGPNFVANDGGELAGVCFTFNAWGEKYTPYSEDAALAGRIVEHVGAREIRSPLVAEGGGICVDGDCTLLTTDTCFPNRNRNPDWSRSAIEDELVRLFGVEKVVWLPGDPLDDETDGHVDGVAAFVRPGVVMVEATTDPADPRREYFQQLRDALEQATDARGRSFELLTLPEARDVQSVGDRFCRSYVNFYFANGAVIAPAYGIATDGEVRERLQSAFPKRKVVQVRIDDIAEGGGGIHCITQQQPRV